MSADDDRLSSALEAFKHDHRQHVSANYPAPGICVSRCPEPWPCKPARAAAALDVVLKHHRPRQLYGMAVSFDGKPLCAHGPDYDGDRHFEGDDGIWYCRDKPTVTVCTSCADGPDGDAWAEWPCPTYSDITRELTGEAGDGR